MKCEIFESLAPLRRAGIQLAVYCLFEWLWHLVGGRPDYIVVTTKQIAYEFGKERRTIEGWFDKAGEQGLIEVMDRDKRRGTIHVYVFHPCPDRRERRPDPQRKLGFGSGRVMGKCARNPSRARWHGASCAKNPRRAW